MIDKYELRQINTDDIDVLYPFYQTLPDETGFENKGFGLNKDEFKYFIIQKQNESQGVNLKDGYVPASEFVFYVNSNLVGIIKLRHYLNDWLLENAGHIGYAIAPQYRGLGYARIMLSLVLQEAKNLNIDKVLIVCEENNIGSYKTIEKCGGKLETIKEGERFYWIEMEGK